MTQSWDETVVAGKLFALAQSGAVWVGWDEIIASIEIDHGVIRVESCEGRVFEFMARELPTRPDAPASSS